MKINLALATVATAFAAALPVTLAAQINRTDPSLPVDPLHILSAFAITVVLLIVAKDYASPARFAGSTRRVAASAPNLANTRAQHALAA